MSTITSPLLFGAARPADCQTSSRYRDNSQAIPAHGYDKPDIQQDRPSIVPARGLRQRASGSRFSGICPALRTVSTSSTVPALQDHPTAVVFGMDMQV
ncbi:hypothetical protein ACFW5G_11665 [Streptomyces griseoaurantiacus]|uniref:hypothetical protein n=1 Tax=Streptomyces griseoaurantiacus TaxID=68213 RepID=UPI0036B53676